MLSLLARMAEAAPSPEDTVVSMVREKDPFCSAEVITQLAKKIEELQVKRDRPYVFPIIWEQDRGLYPSEVRVNFVGSPVMSTARDLLSVFDNNMFASAWITIALLEGHHYASAPRPGDQQLALTLDAIAEYHDKNRNYSNSVMTFWPQAFNDTFQNWQSMPENLLKAFGLFDVVPAKVVEEIMKLLGLESLEHFMESILSMEDSFKRAFHIPPDFDDTFVNIGLGALLTELASDFPDAASRWRSGNSNLSSALEALRQYAYRPFSNDSNVNSIDPRTYYYIRHFLSEAHGRGEDIALVPTWVQNLQDAKDGYKRGVAMPFEINNVDVTVSANVVNGLTTAVLSGLLPADSLDEPLLKQVYVNTTAMIVAQISDHLQERPDLELTYYPSAFEFYWFVARTLSVMETAMLNRTLPPAMQEVYPLLKAALETSMTQDVIAKAQQEGEEMIFFDDFLGDGDVDSHNRSVVHAEDRLFTTAMAINALVTTWTTFDAAKRTVSWKQYVTAEVQDVVHKSARWLNANILKGTYKPNNVFFSGSFKGNSTIPFFYPCNRVEYLNGTRIDPRQQSLPTPPFICSMQGLVPETDYQAMIDQKHFGFNTPTHFTTFNDPNSYFPFWSSPAYTYATSMLALARAGLVAC
ncbi:hypothetical protein C0Q70_14411 [Pomacea canaliculata]|uniref:Uncharacterized protein n=2 Tax=Pomacea canaliculata TaxID=400727 RepID=A0A2T7P006_POMCA|nr:hypothetical protein C0Q70_14411 [Pomacea canaliculata]